MIPIHGFQVDPDAGLVYGPRGVPIGSPDTSGYLQIDGRSRGLGILSAHRLIWVAANGPIPVDREINHKNGRKSDNRLVNMELLTRQGNILHAYAIGLKSNVGEKHPSHRLTDAAVRSIRARYRRDSNARQLGREFGVSRRTVRDAVSGRTWSHVQ